MQDAIENPAREPDPGEPAAEFVPHTLRVIRRGDHTVSRKAFSDGALKVMRRLRECGFVAYLAGGAVRDLLLGRQPKDFDVVTDARPEEVRRIFRNCRLVGRRFRIAHVMFHDGLIEVATFRSLAEPAALPVGQSRHGARTDEGLIVRDNIYGTPEQDAHRRDFTANALFYNPEDFTILDYVGGMEDIQRRMLRCLGDPATRYTEDPVRMIRAVRFAAMLDFEIEPATYAAILEKKDMIELASSARMFDEIQKLFFCGRAVRVFDLLDRTGLFTVLFPDLGTWLANEPEQKAWVERIMRQLDTWRGAGAPVHMELFLALLFGPLHLKLGAERMAQGLAEAPALISATGDHMRKLGNRISIPRDTIQHVGQIMAAQSRFRTTPARKLARFQQHPCFTDAFIYFKICARASGQFSEELAWWEANGFQK